MKFTIFVAIPLILSALSGCGTVPRTTGAMQIGPDTYRIMARASMASQTESQKMAFGEANEYCRKLSLQMMTIGTKSTETDGYEVTFRCLKEGDPELHRPMLQKVPDTVIQVK